MQAVGQIVDRNLHRREAVSRALWSNPGRQPPWRNVATHCRSLQLISHDYNSFAGLKAEGANSVFSAFLQRDDGPFDWVILGLPRQKALLEMLLDHAAGCLSDHGVLWLAGENKAGIKSSVKYLRQYFGEVIKLDSARHCTLFEARRPLKTHDFDRSRYRQQWTVDCGNVELRVISYPGVFAHGRLDPGSELLLEALSGIQLGGDILDFGCGAGVLGACLSAGNDKLNLSYLDSHAIALEACRESLAANQLDGHIIASDGLNDLNGTFDAIISNPPIHDGVKTDNGLGMRLLDRAFDYLKPGGSLIIVANIHLPYEAWLRNHFGHSKQVKANARFKVLRAIKKG